MGRLLIVSNRSPITVRVADGALHLDRSAGGLATGLRGPHERSKGLWIGWPGPAEGLDEAQRHELARRLDELRIAPVEMTEEEVQGYYEGVSNGVLWPLFHSFVDQLPLEVDDVGVYERINERFAEVTARHYQPGDQIWVHDYQLMLVPRLVRERCPDARIGFFLHIPFPASDLFRTLPYRERVIEGLLGADLIGFHAAAYMRNFASSVIRTLGVLPDVAGIPWQNRYVRLGVFPMGIDAGGFAAMAGEDEVLGQAEALRAGGTRVLVGIDRLDYTKGIPRRLLAFEALLREHPELREQVRLIQVAVPSRTNVEAYRDFRAQVDSLIGRIHGTFGTPQWAPIHYVFRNLGERDIVALYRAADVMLVTPIRDGMNLVAKEFVASRPDEDGVLVLSEFAGAASELAEALHVNPYDIPGTAETIHRALMMPAAERSRRMRALRRRVMAYDVHRWVRTFLTELEQSGVPEPPSLIPSPPETVRGLLRQLRAADFLVLLLDYDGTLVSFAPTPALAEPDESLLGLLRALAARPRTDVHVISGRLKETLDEWLGALPIGLHAEHGLWSRPPGTETWTAPEPTGTDWRDAVRAILDDFAARTPGSLVEEKTASIAWHYRLADPEYGVSQANELSLHLRAMLSNEPVEILPGAKVIEIRPHGQQKGRLVAPIVAAAPPGATVVAFGDDRTDEDLFAALPPEATAVHVGSGPSMASVRLRGVREVRDLLRALVEKA